MEHLENFTDPSLRKRKTNHLSGKDLEYGSSKPVKRQLWTSFDDKSPPSLRQSLHLSLVPEDVISRDLEYHSLQTFVTEHCLAAKSGILYVCGPPGTGKSLLVNKVRKELLEGQAADKCAVVSLNCMAVEPSKIYHQVLAKLSQCGLKTEKKGTPSKNSAAKAKERFISLLNAEGPTIVLILDEMDRLVARDQTLICDLFRLPSQCLSRIVIIGIANTIDLTNKFLPKLNDLKIFPLVLNFSAYKKDQICSILEQRLRHFSDSPFDHKALELCARRVAASSGDMRKALDVCRLAIDVRDEEAISTCQSSSAVDEELVSMKKVQLGHMAKALSESFKSPDVERIQALPQHQQLVLCAAVKSLSGKKKDTTVGQLNFSYSSLCKESMVKPLTTPEFSSMCSVLADQALINIGKGKEERLRRITLKVQKEDCLFALQGIRFFRKLLDEPGSSFSAA